MSSSASASNTATSNRDGRVAGDNGAIGVSAEGDVGVSIVADEAFELGSDAIRGIVDANRGIVRANDGFLDAVEDQSDLFAEGMSEALYASQKNAERSTETVSDGLSYALAETADFAHAALETVASSGRKANDAISGALAVTQQNSKSEAGQIGEQLIKMAIPAAALAFVAAQVLK